MNSNSVIVDRLTMAPFLRTASFLFRLANTSVLTKLQKMRSQSYLNSYIYIYILKLFNYTFIFYKFELRYVMFICRGKMFVHIVNRGTDDSEDKAGIASTYY